MSITSYKIVWRRYCFCNAKVGSCTYPDFADLYTDATSQFKIKPSQIIENCFWPTGTVPVTCNTILGKMRSEKTYTKSRAGLHEKSLAVGKRMAESEMHRQLPVKRITLIHVIFAGYILQSYT